MTSDDTEAEMRRQIDRQIELQVALSAAQPVPFVMPRRPFFPRVSRLDPAKYHGDRWAIDGRASERYTAKTWRMCVHVVLALVFG